MFHCIPELDYNIGYRYFLGNLDNYTNALMSILKSVKSKLPLLKSMCSSGDFGGLRTITQTLRIMFGNVGAINLAETTYQIETALLQEDTVYIQEQLTEYIKNITVLSEHLELLLKKVDVVSLGGKEEEQVSFLNYDFTKTKESIRQSSDYLERRII
jgi:HPt (histidine-containing phosphotransfer) domain-containing protein